VDPNAPARDRIIAALMALVAERSIEEVGFADIAGRAGVSLADLRQEFGGKLAIVAACVKDIDRKVLAGGDADLAEEPPRERLFDVLMRRLEALAPHRTAIKSLMRSARRHPSLALALNSLAVRSQQWMLTAANIDAAGPRGWLRAQGVAFLYARVPAPSWRMTIRGLPAPWQRSIAHSGAASAGRAISTICATSRRTAACRACAAEGAMMRNSTSRRCRSEDQMTGIR